MQINLFAASLNTRTEQSSKTPDDAENCCPFVIEMSQILNSADGVRVEEGVQDNPGQLAQEPANGPADEVPGPRPATGNGSVNVNQATHPPVQSRIYQEISGKQSCDNMQMPPVSASAVSVLKRPEMSERGPAPIKVVAKEGIAADDSNHPISNDATRPELGEGTLPIDEPPIPERRGNVKIPVSDSVRCSEPADTLDPSEKQTPPNQAPAESFVTGARTEQDLSEDQPQRRGSTRNGPAQIAIPAGMIEAGDMGSATVSDLSAPDHTPARAASAPMPGEHEPEDQFLDCRSRPDEQSAERAAETEFKRVNPVHETGKGPERVIRQSPAGENEPRAESKDDIPASLSNEPGDAGQSAPGRRFAAKVENADSACDDENSHLTNQQIRNEPVLRDVPDNPERHPARTPAVARNFGSHAQVVENPLHIPLTAAGSGEVIIESAVARREPDAFIGQVSERIRIQVAGGSDSIRIRLQPDSFGHLEIRAEATANGVVARIVAESESVRNYLENNLHVLQQTLLEQGIKVDRLNVLVETGTDLSTSAGHTAESGHGGSGHQERQAHGNRDKSGLFVPISPDETTVDPAARGVINGNGRFYTVA